jgi:hypothetical protein
VAEAATHRRTVRQETAFLAPPLGMVLDLGGADPAGPQLLFDDRHGGLFHSRTIDRNPVEQIFRRCLPHVSLDALQIEKHGISPRRTAFYYFARIAKVWELEWRLLRLR